MIFEIHIQNLEFWTFCAIADINSFINQAASANGEASTTPITLIFL